MIRNFIVNAKEFGVTEDDVEAVFTDSDGGMNPTDKIIFSDAKDLEGLAVASEIFPSRTRARKNNFSGPIPHGLSCLGTKKKRFWVWNPVQGEEPTLTKNFNHTDKMLGDKPKQKAGKTC